MRNLVLFIVAVLILASCSPRILTLPVKKLPPVANNQEIEVYNFVGDIPANAEKLGVVKVTDSGFTTNCGYDVMLGLVKQEARKMGGNTICIIDHLEPNIMGSSCHQFLANVYSVSSQMAAKNDSNQKTVEEKPLAIKQIETKDTIKITKKGLGYTYMYKGESLNLYQMKTLLINNNEAYKLYESAKGSTALISVLAYAGGFCVGYGTVYAFKYPEVGLKVLGIGAGIIVLTMPLVSAAEKKLMNAVSAYNMDTQTKAFIPAYKLQLATTNNGIGVVVKF